jgi:hypothetical protein
MTTRQQTYGHSGLCFSAPALHVPKVEGRKDGASVQKHKARSKHWPKVQSLIQHCETEERERERREKVEE